MSPKSSTACAELNQCMALTHSGHSRTQALITACQSDNLEYGDTSVKCLDCVRYHRGSVGNHDRAVRADFADGDAQVLIPSEFVR
jgi:hypothetical protein